MQIIYTTIKKEDLRKIIKKETGLSLWAFAQACPKSYAYLYAVDNDKIKMSSEKWDKLKAQIQAVKESLKK